MMQNDNETFELHGKVITYNKIIRRNLILEIVNLTIVIGLLASSWYVWNESNIDRKNREYIATDEQGIPLVMKRHTEQIKTPLNDEDKEQLIPQIEYTLNRCLNFDYTNYANISSECITNKFSLNKFGFEQFNAGQLFYKSLESAGVIKLLYKEKSSLSTKIKDLKLIKEGIKQRPVKVTGELGYTKTRNLESYYYTFKAKMTMKVNNKKLQIPEDYTIEVEKMSELVRIYPVGIRSIVAEID